MKTLLLALCVAPLTGCFITTTITGSGRVTSTGGHDCGPASDTSQCTVEYRQAGSEILTATPAEGYAFTEWGGCVYLGIDRCQTDWNQASAEHGVGGIDTATISAKFEQNSPRVTQTVTFAYNALGQRVSKSVNGQTTLFQYDHDGSLIAEIDAATGKPLREHIHANGEPIAQLSAGVNGEVKVHYVHADHLGTPTLLTDQSGRVVADIEATPFGEAYIDYTAIDHNRRFPGQYKDEETGLHYNYFRDYDPSIGAYIQADRLDVLGRTHDPQLHAQGIYGEGWFRFDGKWYYDGQTELNHPYGYAARNPNSYTDAMGLHHKAGHNWKPPKAEHPLGYYVTKPNGNLLDGFGRQDDKCSVPGVGCLMDKDPELLQRCIDHDQCYRENLCNYTSWFGNLLGAKKSCNQCNSSF